MRLSLPALCALIPAFCRLSDKALYLAKIRGKNRAQAV
jgi:PleD family two-component response regulator